MAKKIQYSHGREEHEKKILEQAQKYLLSNRNTSNDNLRLDIIKKGDLVFLRTSITEQPNEHGPGGFIAHRGDPVIVQRIFATNPSYTTLNKDKVCEISWRYVVSHPNIFGGHEFGVYRHEIMNTDPVLTKHDETTYLSKSSFKTLDDRFKIKEKKK